MVAAGVLYVALAVGERVDDDRLEVYVQRLVDLKDEQVFGKAVLLLADRCERMPKIPEFRDAYFEVRDRDRPVEAEPWVTPDMEHLLDHCLGPCDRKLPLGVLMLNNGFCDECEPPPTPTTRQEIRDMIANATKGMP